MDVNFVQVLGDVHRRLRSLATAHELQVAALQSENARLRKQLGYPETGAMSSASEPQCCPCGATWTGAAQDPNEARAYGSEGNPGSDGDGREPAPRTSAKRLTTTSEAAGLDPQDASRDGRKKNSRAIMARRSQQLQKKHSMVVPTEISPMETPDFKPPVLSAAVQKKSAKFQTFEQVEHLERQVSASKSAEHIGGVTEVSPFTNHESETEELNGATAVLPGAPSDDSKTASGEARSESKDRKRNGSATGLRFDMDLDVVEVPKMGHTQSQQPKGVLKGISMVRRVSDPFSREDSLEDEACSEESLQFEIAECFAEISASMVGRRSMRRSTVMKTVQNMTQPLAVILDKRRSERVKRDCQSIVDLQMSKSRESLCQSMRHNIALFVRNYIMLEPFTLRFLMWELILFMFVVWDTATIPLQAFDPPDSEGMNYMVWLVRLFWSLDVLVSLFTGYLDEDGTVVMDPKMTMRRYVQGHMFMDLAVVFADWMEAIIGSRAGAMVKSWKIMRIIRLIRLRKAREISKGMLDRVFRGEKTVVIAVVARIICMMVLLTHLLACTWYLAGARGPDGWVTQYDVRNFSLQERYIRSFHFAISIFFGEHTIMPHTILERVFVVVNLIATFVIQIWFVSSITSAMTRLEIISTRKSAQMTELQRYMTMNMISREVQVKVQRNANFAIEEQERNAPESSIELLKVISQPLMMDLHFEIHFPMMCVHPFFRCYNLVNPAGIRQICHAGMAWLYLSRDDLVFQDMETPDLPRVMFIQRGHLSYAQDLGTSEGVKEVVVDSRHWVGEAFLWVQDWMHCGTLRSQTDCKVLALDVQKFQALIMAHTASVGQCRLYAEGFVAGLNATQDVTDIASFNTKDLKREDGRFLRTEEKLSTLRNAQAINQLLYNVFPDWWETAQTYYLNTKTRFGLEREVRACDCGNELMSDAQFCRKCGRKWADIESTRTLPEARGES
eukprot:TRINITY_DN112736_c0_g1_i2.p1 TRINITY_DN112736_c0_g1~~TRINITY_DN112736_c0_g1_i2.p1  ORF type:complete len:958 (-),score=201.33 TRINITY_DN112736_c0_g1_i2:326-3199(-)